MNFLFPFAAILLLASLLPDTGTAAAFVMSEDVLPDGPPITRWSEDVLPLIYSLLYPPYHLARIQVVQSFSST